MGSSGAAAIVCALFLTLVSSAASAQESSPSEKLAINTPKLFVWHDRLTHIYQTDQPVTVGLDQATLHADSAVFWLQPADKVGPGRWHVTIALIGHASLVDSSEKRSGDRLLVRVELLGKPDIHATMVKRSQAESAIFREGQALLAPPDEGGGGGADAGAGAPQLAAGKESAADPGHGKPQTRPTTRPVPAGPVSFSAGHVRTIDTPEGTVAVLLTDNVVLFQRRAGGDFVEMRADSAVAFTTLTSLHDLTDSERSKAIEDNITGVYLEGDVRIVYTPIKPMVSEQRLEAKRVYYDLTTNRAILTDAVVHSIDIKQQVPMVIRARILRQLAAGEYNAQKVQLTTSTFALPSLDLAAKQLYVRTEDSGPDAGDVYFQAKPAVLNAFGVPYFYAPQASGTISPNGEGLVRGLSAGNITGFGTTVGAAFGLFESLGMDRPANLDALYRVDYFTERGPGFGLTADYNGGTLTDTTKQPLDFAGDFNGYMAYDKGTDDLGRLPVKFDGPGSVLRGQAEYEHTQYFPDGWEGQIRLGYVSDPTFLEQYFYNNFTEGLPHDDAGYLKYQDQTEAFTMLVDAQPNHFVTTSDSQANQFEVEKLPEVSYHRIGDSALDDQVTVFSDNSLDGLHFQRSDATLREQGFGGPFEPGLPSLGNTGLTDAVTFRGDFRQEVDYPQVAGPIRVVPYVVGRFTQYSDSPADGPQSRAFGALGLRMSTELWKVDPTVQSDLFDLHELRHVIEPTVNLFTSGENVDRGRLYQYDDEVDAINDVTAAQIALYQRWETKRGGPGQWRSVDAFTFNVELNLFANQPSKAQLNPDGFRGMFFQSMPEASLARNSLNADASWRISDNTVVLADESYNLDQYELATAAVGILVRRDVQTDYYIENRYISALRSDITSFHLDYQITPKYTVALDQSFDFDANQEVYSGIGIARRFDTFTVTMEYIHNETDRTDSFTFNIVPAGLSTGVGSNSLANSFHQ